MRPILLAFLVLLAGLPVSKGLAAEPVTHRMVVQVDQDDPALANQALGNIANAIDYYRGQGEAVQVELVAFGPGLTMLRADTSPVKERIQALQQNNPPGMVVFSACNNTLKAVEKREGHPVQLVPEAGVVPSGTVRLIQLQEQGWGYFRP